MKLDGLITDLIVHATMCLHGAMEKVAVQLKVVRALVGDVVIFGCFRVMECAVLSL